MLVRFGSAVQESLASGPPLNTRLLLQVLAATSKELTATPHVLRVTHGALTQAARESVLRAAAKQPFQPRPRVGLVQRRRRQSQFFHARLRPRESLPSAARSAGGGSRLRSPCKNNSKLAAARCGLTGRSTPDSLRQASLPVRRLGLSCAARASRPASARGVSSNVRHQIATSRDAGTPSRACRLQ